MMGQTVAIITARGKSRRIPGKNIKDFCGEPIIAYSIRAAKAAGIFDEIMVSTDDEKIAEIARLYGAEVPFMRSAANSDDYAVTADVIREVIAQYKQRGRDFERICCIYPTAPFVTGLRLKECMELLDTADSVIPVVRFSFPPQRSIVIENGYAKMKWPEFMNARSQDLEPYYHDCGQFYCIKTDSFMESGNIIMDKTVPVVISELEVQDIDHIEDWEIAEMKYKLLKKRSGGYEL